MDDMIEDNISLYEQVKKDKRPVVEMDITSLVDCSEPLFSTTNYSNDNIALLEAGFNKEIEKNTTLLLEQEKETEVYLAIRKLLEKEAANNLLPEVEASNPAYKLFIQFKADNGSLAIKNCGDKVKKLEDGCSNLRSKLLNATNQLAQLSKNATKKSKGGVYSRDGKYYARWTTIPAKLIAEFQTNKDDPLAVYRELRNIVVTNPEKASHENTTKLLRRYKDALPNDAPRQVVKECIAKRLEELRKLEYKDIYTRAVLLKYIATCMSEEDCQLIESYLEANSKSVPMKEMASSVIKSRMQNLIRQTTIKPAEQMLPLNPHNRQHQLFHRLAVEEKALPKVLRVNQGSVGKKSNTTFKTKKSFKNTKFQQQKFQQTTGNTRKNQQFSQKKQFSGASRPRVNRQQNQTSRGGQAQQATNGNRKSQSKKAENSEAAVAQLRNAYDITKISDQLEHFGNTTPEVQLMLQHQLIQRSIDVAPNPKKPSVTPPSA